MKKLLLRGGVLLSLSALISKFLGLWRDRLFIEVFGDLGSVDIIFASFRIPDFFFFLLIGGTVSTLFLPRIAELDKKSQKEFFSSFLWGVLLLFGVLCGLGAFFTLPLIHLFAGGFSPEMQLQMVPLAQMLFGSVFLLAVSSVFAAYQQSKERFLSLALAPIFYTLTLCLFVFFFREQKGLFIIGLGALTGAGIHLLFNAGAYFYQKNSIGIFWKKPLPSWKNFSSDFFQRVINNASFQINQSADVLIASFLMLGSVTAFTLGTNLALAPLTIIGFSIANATFPKLTKAQKNRSEQKKILLNALNPIAWITIPGTILALLFPGPLLTLIYGLDSALLPSTKIVFSWTVLTLPLACMIPVMSRVFLAQNDTKTPLKITLFSLFCATSLAAFLSLVVLPKENAIWGLAMGNFTANLLSASLFGVALYKYFSDEKND